MKKFGRWLKRGEYTPYGEVFDCDYCISRAIERYVKGVAPLKCGGNLENDNGNGSLMRILPVAISFNRASIIVGNFLKIMQMFSFKRKLKDMVVFGT